MLRAPFLDVCGAMLDTTLPLTCEELSEWGDPADAAAWEAMRTFCPYASIPERDAAAYPALLICAAVNDPRVSFTQALRYLARLRERAPAAADGAPQLLHMRTVGGHHGDGGRFRRLEQLSVEYAFLSHALGVLEDLDSG